MLNQQTDISYYGCISTKDSVDHYKIQSCQKKKIMSTHTLEYDFI